MPLYYLGGTRHRQRTKGIDRMRVLWFTSVIPPAIAEHLAITSEPGPAAWVESLRQSLHQRAPLDLGIASLCPITFAPFRVGGTTYYGVEVAQPASRVGRAIQGWRGSFAAEDTTGACDAIVRDFKPDLIHVHGTENPFGLIGRHSRTPVVISLQGLLTAYERFYFRGLTAQEIARLALSKDFVLGRGEIHGYWRCVNMAAREREIFRANRFFIGRTGWDMTILRAVNPEATYFHCDEVLRPPFYDAAWHRDPARSVRTLFCTSSTITSKGMDTLIEALAILRATGDADVRLRVAGIPSAGPASRYFAARARKHQVADSIHWLGRLEASQLADELAAANIFVYPSHFDNSPNALCEALLVGVPSVASYAGGIPSLLEDGREGLLYSPGDPYALADRIHRLLEDEALAAKLGMKGRDRALHRHDPDKIVADLLRIYQRILSR